MQKYILLIMLTILAATSSGVERKKKSCWPPECKDIKYLSSADHTMQPAMFYNPGIDKPVPLLVTLHTWSGNYRQAATIAINWCIQNKWVFIQPNFRGHNGKPEAMGSELVVKDIISAVDYAKKQVKIDLHRIYLLGGSGGGYAALLMAGRAPEIWAGVSAWCPISNLKKWHQECKAAKRGYYKNIERAIQGVPGQDPKADEECRKRSAITYLKNAKKVNLDIGTGIHDGHSGSVPISHTLEAFNEVAAEKDRIPTDVIKLFVEKETTPPSLQKESGGILGSRKIHFRRVSGNVRITIFEGGHNILSGPGINWLRQQRKGVPASWDIKQYKKVDCSKQSSELAK